MGEWLHAATARLGARRVDDLPDAPGDAAAAGLEARLQAEVLLRHVTGRDRASVVARPEAVIERDARVTLDALAARVARGEPLAYVTGSREFWSMDFTVNPAVLVPRADTETLVECALDCLPGDPGALVLEAGTGSGAVAVALASECANAIVATDLSAAALSVARVNAGRLLAPGRIAFVRGDWLEAFADASVALLVSNPPYLAASDPHLAALRTEPRAALVAASDGLGALERLVVGGTRVVRAGGEVLLEHGAAQGDAVRALFESHGYADVRTHRDLAGLERVSGARVR